RDVEHGERARVLGGAIELVLGALPDPPRVEDVAGGEPRLRAQDQRSLAYGDHVAGAKGARGLHPLAVEEGAVVAGEVGDLDLSFGDDQPGVVPRGRAGVEVDVRILGAPHDEHAVGWDLDAPGGETLD